MQRRCGPILIHIVIGAPELGADGEDKVGLRHHLADRREAGTGRYPQRMTTKDAAPIGGCDNRRVHTFGQRDEVVCRADSAAPGKDQRPRGGAEAIGGVSDDFRVRHVTGYNRCTHGWHLDLLLHHIKRNLDMYRTRTPAGHGREGTLHHTLKIRAAMKGMGPQRHLTHHRGLIGQLVQETFLMAERRGGVHTRDHQHRH